MGRASKASPAAPQLTVRDRGVQPDRARHAGQPCHEDDEALVERVDARGHACQDVEQGAQAEGERGSRSRWALGTPRRL